MRRLLLSVVLFVSSFAIAHETKEKHAHAKYFENNVGGATVITDRQNWCRSTNSFDGYAWGSNGGAVKFCWVPRGNKVLVKFEGENDTGVWPMEIFQDLDDEPDLNILFPVNERGS